MKTLLLLLRHAIVCVLVPFHAAYVAADALPPSGTEKSLGATSQALPQYEVDKINEYFKSSFHLNLECSKGVTFPKVKLFGQGENIYMLRDSNSDMGFSVAELKKIDAGEYYHRKGMRFLRSNLATATDFFVSSETLRAGSAQLTILLVGEIYSCDVSLDTWPAENAEKRISAALERGDQRAAATEQLKAIGYRVGLLLEPAIHRALTDRLVLPDGIGPDARVVLKIKVDKSGSITDVKWTESSGSPALYLAARQAAMRLALMDDVNPREFPELEPEFKKIAEDARAIASSVGLLEPSIQDLLGDEHFFYIEINASKTFKPVPEGKRE